MQVTVMEKKRIDYTQVVWEITRMLQEADSLEDALRASLGEVVKAVGAEAGTVWAYNISGDKRIYPSFWIGGADLLNQVGAVQHRNILGQGGDGLRTRFGKHKKRGSGGSRRTAGKNGRQWWQFSGINGSANW